MKFRVLILCGLLGVLLAAQASRTVLDGVYSPEQAVRGKEIYADKCYMCHGRALLGEGESPALSGNRFLTEWETVSVGALFDRIRTGMPIKTPGTLSRQQAADLTAFLLYFNGFPSGQTELSTKSELLQDIQIVLPQRR
jgi:mono/diheme cytochrome c family protein